MNNIPYRFYYHIFFPEHVTMNLELPFTIIKKEDGDTYLRLINKPKYSYDLQKAVFEIKHLIIGDNDLSKYLFYY